MLSGEATVNGTRAKTLVVVFAGDRIVTQAGHAALSGPNNEIKLGPATSIVVNEGNVRLVCGHVTILSRNGFSLWVGMLTVWPKENSLIIFSAKATENGTTITRQRGSVWINSSDNRLLSMGPLREFKITGQEDCGK